MISSTARDLPEHRKEVMDACLRQGMFPTMMEHLPASDADAITASLKLVDEADIYVGVFAHRYGYVPVGHDISITEMEYYRAVERNIPRLIFVMDKTHPITINAVEQGASSIKLKAFKERIQTENIVNFFKSPADLRAHVINSLSQLRHPDLTIFHYVSDIPEPPEVFVAHPYTLLQTGRLIGRQEELSLLTDWVSKQDSEVYKARILNIVAIGGLGKSALTWMWFKNVAPQEMKPLAGRMWWSFYESDATFENFVTRALAYATRSPLAEVQQIPAPERETQLLAALNREPFLIVLDGLERELIAYARMDAARLDDSRVDSQRKLRKTADPRAGRFLKKLAQVTDSRVLVSTRLYPADLETEGGDPLHGSFRRGLTGLTDEDAVELWRALNVSGARDQLLPVFATFDKHPLLIQALAGEVKRYRPGPGDFDKWRKANPQFDPTKFSLLQDAMSHVLEFALRGLNYRVLQVLQIIAAFRMPARYDTLAALLIGEAKPCADERELDEVLTELEDRGLVGWDKHANRYDLHPIVRGVIWSGLTKDIKRDIYEELHSYFESVPPVDWREVDTLDDLVPVIELYNTLCELDRYDDAITLFSDRLKDVFYHRLSGNREITEMLERLFDKEQGFKPRLTEKRDQAFALNRLAVAYKDSGKAAVAAHLFQRSNELYKLEGDTRALISGLGYVAEVMERRGQLYESELVARSGLRECERTGVLSEKPFLLVRLGMTLEARGKSQEASEVLRHGLRAGKETGDLHVQGFLMIRSAENMLRVVEARDVL
ncbi:MAG TPA: DUF4062 domain-containing protein, partial [Pyrinomonadaceae bacterium]|nr:DUF4062 domain-containing protein [Pyrinomonadaceae bacterium]